MPADLTRPFGESCCDGGACNNDMSAQSCGCDPGLKPKPWICQQHQLEAILEASARANQNHIDNILEDLLFEKETNGKTEETP